MQKIHIGSLTFPTGDVSQFLDLLRNWRVVIPDSARGLGYVNPHVYNQATKNPRVREFLADCDFVSLDGIGTAMAGRILNGKMLSRIVMDQLFDLSMYSGIISGKVLLLGLSAEENTLAAKNLLLASSRFQIAGSYHGYLPIEEYTAILREHAEVDFVLVGMGSPKSESILLSAMRICSHAICWHAGGGTLRNWAGTKSRAPKIISRVGMEWLHRVLYEPQTRSRYAMGIPVFAYNLAMDLSFRSRKPKYFLERSEACRS